MWSSKPSNWVLLSSAADVAIVSTLALSSTLMEPLPWRILAEVAIAALGFALLLDQIKLLVRLTFKIG